MCMAAHHKVLWLGAQGDERSKRPQKMFSQTPLDIHRIVQRFNLVRIFESILPPDLIHRLHDDDALVPSHGLALQSAISQTSRAFVSLPKHAMARNLLFHPVYVPISIAHRNKSPIPGSVSRAVNLDFTLSPLDTDCRPQNLMPVGERRNPKVCQSYSVSFMVRGHWGRHRKGKEHGSLLICTSLGILGDRGEDGWPLTIRGSQSMINRLEDPSQAVDAD